MVGPMKLTMAPELGSTGEPEMSCFQRLSLAKGTNPLRLAPCPVLMAPQALCWLLPEPEPEPLPEPLPEPDPLPLPDPLPEPDPPDENVEPAAPPPQFAHETAKASTTSAASAFFHENFMILFSQGIAPKMARSQATPRR